VTARPRLLTLLAALGMLLGCFGALYSMVVFRSLLEPRDRYIETYREAASREPLMVGEGVSKEDVERLFEQVAGAIYDRRGTAIPLAAINVILSTLLFLGCGRALRGNPWGLSAWTLAAAASIPYQVLDAVYGLVKTREIATVVAQSGKLAAMSGAWTSVQTSASLLQASVEILYFGICLLYLRRPSIQALFR
jgi:hypothetical protein